MTKAFKKAAAVVLSAALLTTTAVAILPSATAESSIPNPGNWQYSMAQDFNSTTNAGDGGSDIDYWQSSGKIHRVQWLATDAKGVDGSKAVYVHTAIGTNDNYTDELSVNTTNSGVAGNCTNMKFNSTDVTSPTEIWIWVDFTGTTTPERFRFNPRVYIGDQKVDLMPKDGGAIYFQTSTGWKASAFKKYTGETNADLNDVYINDADLTGFKGYIRMPLDSFNSSVGGTATTIDWANSHITDFSSYYTGLQTAFDFKYDSSKQIIDDGFYLDNVMIVGATAAGGAKVSDLLPKANANLQYVSLQDFNSLTNSSDGNTDLDYWQSTSGHHEVQWLVTDAKGADGTKGLYVHTAYGSSDNGVSELSINRHNYGIAGNCTTMKFNTIDVTSPTELWVWVDFTGTTNPERFCIYPRLTVDTQAVDLSPKDGAPVYFQTASGWKASSFKSYTGASDKELNNVFINDTDLTGFKGYIRMPLSSFTTAVSGTATPIDWTTAEITAIGSYYTGLQTAFNFQYDTQGKLIDDGFYLDNLMIVGTPKANALNVSDLSVPDVSLVETTPTTTTGATTTTAEPTTTTSEVTTTTTQTPVITIPDASSYKAGMVEDFESLAAGKAYANWGDYYKLAADEGKDGVGAWNSRGLYIHTTTSAGGYTQPFYYMNKDGDFTGATELWIWLDFSNYKDPGNLTIRPRLTVDGASDDVKMIGSAPVYLQTSTGWKASTLTDAPADKPTDECAIRSTDLTGFKGYIRIPLTDFRASSGSPLSGNISNFTGGYWLFNFTGEADANENFVENGYVMDNVALVGPSVNSTLTAADLLSATAPTTTTVPATTTTTTEETTTTTESTTVSTAPTATTQSSASTTQSAASTTAPSESTATTKSTAAVTTEATTVATNASVTEAPTDETTAEETTAATTEATSPKTGESSAAAACALVVLAAASGALLVSKKRK